MGLLDKLADKTMDTVVYCYALKEGAKTAVKEVVKEVVIPATAVVAGRFIEPSSDEMNKLTQIAESKDFDKFKPVMPKFSEESEWDYIKRLGKAVELGQSFREDVQRHLELKKAHEEGYRQGNVDAAKKFAALLEQSDNMRIGSFAIGCHVARLGGNSDKKLGVIVDALGEPNSFALSDYVRSENNKILCDNLRFDEISNKYLDSLNAEQLKSIDGFLQEIINAGGATYVERSFYQNEWTAYLNQRIK